MSEEKDYYLEFLQLNAWDRLKRVEEILDYFVAGEKNNKLLLFFLILGDLHPNYKSFKIYRGDPGGGKNVVANAVLNLFPANKVYVLDGATAKALNYDEDIKESELVYLRELEKHESVIELLKGLYNADGRIFKETVQDKDSKAHYVKHHEISRKGILTTFSFENIAADIESRSWMLVPDQTYEQTRKVIKFYIDKEKTLIDRVLTEKEIKNRCFFISKCIEKLDFGYDIYIPYIEQLEVLLPEIKLNVRRDREKLFNLIKIITLWNQYNRRSLELNGTKFLFSEYTDLKMSLEICQDLFINLVLHIDDIKRHILDFMGVQKKGDKKPVENNSIMNYSGDDELLVAQELFKQKYIETEVVNKFTVTEIYEEINTKATVSRKTVSNKLHDLFYEGYLLQEKEKNKYYYTKIRDYNLIKMLNLDEIQEKINGITDQAYIFYSNKTGEILETTVEEDEDEF